MLKISRLLSDTWRFVNNGIFVTNIFQDGVELYKNYLKTENVGELLDFW